MRIRNGSPKRKSSPKAGRKPQNPEEFYLAAIQKDPHNVQAYEALAATYLQNVILPKPRRRMNF